MTASALFARFFEDAGLIGEASISLADAVRRHRELLDTRHADILGPLVVADRDLGALGRSSDGEPIDVRVVVSGGAGGLLALARRSAAGIRVVAADSTLRDLDDLVGNAGRVVAAAEELDGQIRVHVDIPDAPGWLDAVAEIEAAGLAATISLSGAGSERSDPRRLARRMSGLIEADLPFTVRGTSGARSARDAIGVLDALAAVYALIEGASDDEAAGLLAGEDDPATTIAGWDEAAAARIRRRWLSAGCVDLPTTLAALDALGLLPIRQASAD